LAWNRDLPPVDALRLADIEVLLRDEMLPKLDRAGMAFGLEGRPPLLDDDFVAAMMAVPAKSHLAHPGGKALLRQWAVELCPVVDDKRPKHGFDVPMGLWLTGPLRDDVARLLLDPGRRGLTDATAARRTWARMTAGTPGSAHTLFAMLVAELWYEENGAKAA
jgi:asparagine synthase (glutamine-hydrolysing)